MSEEKQEVVNLDSYDHIVVAFSGGKDSLACFLHLLDQGVDKSKIELWHHDIDGREGEPLMDWTCTPDYCRKFAEAFGVKIYYSWKEGGFEREMLRNETRTAPTRWENPDGTIGTAGGTRGKLGTRRKFPQVSADLSVRWCSAYLKVDVCSASIRNQSRFDGKRTLVITGERAEESSARANYKTFEPDRSDNRNGRKARLVDHWRPVHGWLEKQVWEIIERYNVRVHPCYYLGWGRCSCAACIFGSCHQFASLAKIAPTVVDKVAGYEKEFGCTIKRKKSIPELVAEGTPYESMTDEDAQDALSKEYKRGIIVEGEWTLPAGAYGESCGPS